MTRGIRIVASVAASIAAFLCAILLEFLIAVRLRGWPGYLAWLRPLLPFACAAVVLRYLLPKAPSVPAEVGGPSAAQSGCSGLAWSAFVGALVTGGIGFVAGFFGPMILAPSSPQGPLVGLFVTGPLGILAGAVGGAAVFWAKRR